MCDNFLLTITANLYIDDPTKVGHPRYMHACKAFIEYLSAHTVPNRLNQLIYQFQLSHSGTIPFPSNNVTVNSLKLTFPFCNGIVRRHH